MNLTKAMCLSAVVASLVTAGCGALQQQPVIPSQAPAAARLANSSDLLYLIGSYGARKLSVFTSPAGQPQHSVLMPHGGVYLCSDARGHVFAPTYDVIFEYAHGGRRPIAEIADQGARSDQCSGDPMTGNLAVINTVKVTSCSVAIFKGAKGPPAIHTASRFRICQYPAYDARGNLFVVASTQTKSYLLELPYQGDKFTAFLLNEQLANLYDMHFDGQYLAVQAKELGTEDRPIVIYRVKVSGTKLVIVKTLRFGGWRNQVEYFAVANGYLLTNIGESEVGVWAYPKAGGMLSHFTAVDSPTSYAISVAPQR
ncbi:MAG TPA: hypothetical protein VGG51_08650 [Candidatus Cybelea sp.]|jgi:hypothetical protein